MLFKYYEYNCVKYFTVYKYIICNFYRINISLSISTNFHKCIPIYFYILFINSNFYLVIVNYL